MKRSIVLAVAVLVACSAQAVVPQKPGNDPGTLEKKVQGAWKGQTGCAGNFLFRADGTYELKGHGPGADDSTGVWKVLWDALPPTLVLTCKTADFDGYIGQTTKVKLTRLDDEGLAIKHANKTVDRYARVKN